MKRPKLSCLKQPQGMLFLINKSSDSARATAERMGMMPEINRDLNRPGNGIKLAVGMGRDGEWMRAIVACNAPEITGFDWLEFAVSPVTTTTTDWLFSLMSEIANADINTLRLVERSSL